MHHLVLSDGLLQNQLRRECKEVRRDLCGLDLKKIVMQFDFMPTWVYNYEK